VTAPAWLDELQAEFSRLLRTPLASSSGTFRSQPGVYPPGLLSALAMSSRNTTSAAVQLSLYHEQYWMRLFTTLQGRYPRLAWAMGYWHFNHLAALHLTEHPPRHFDIDSCGEGFGTQVSEALAQLPGNDVATRAWRQPLTQCRSPVNLLQQALMLDEAERRVFLAPCPSIWKWTPSEMASLAERRLRFAEGFARVAEDWQLIACSSLAGVASQPSTDKPPPKHSETLHWVIFRTPTGVGTQRVAPAFARLLELCENEPFGVALQRLESELAPAQLASVRHNLASWTRQALTLGWWIGLEA
jgi:Putative DNA-binding domain